MIRVVIVGDVRLHREGLAELLRRDTRIEIVGTGADWARKLYGGGEQRPDVVVLDTVIPNSLAVARSLLSALPQAKIVAIASSDTDNELIAYAEVGIAGFVTREASLEELVTAIDGAAKGETVLSPRVAAVVLSRLSEVATRGPRAQEPRLTRREHEVIELVDEGLTNKEIAGRLFIEVPTVKNHVHNILEKLGVNRRAEAAAQLRSRPAAWTDRASRSRTRSREPTGLDPA